MMRVVVNRHVRARVAGYCSVEVDRVTGRDASRTCRPPSLPYRCVGRRVAWWSAVSAVGNP